MKSNVIVITLAITAAIVVAGAVVISTMISSRQPTISMPPSAPGSLRPGEKVSPHFIASIERPRYNTFCVAVMPTSNNHNIYIYPGKIEPILFDEKGNQIHISMPMAPPDNPNLPQFAIEIDSSKIEKGPAGSNRTVKWERRTFIMHTHKLPKGKYTVSARVEEIEVGSGAVQGACFNGAIAVRVTNSFTLVVK